MYLLGVCFQSVPLQVMQFARAPESGVIPLAKGFIHADGHAVRQVQAACLVNHRNADTGVRVGFQQLLRQPARLLAEDEVGIVRIADLRVYLTRLGEK